MPSSSRSIGAPPPAGEQEGQCRLSAAAPKRNPHYMCSFVAGGLAGAVSRTATAPLDRVKILAQEGLIHSSAPRPIHADDGAPVTCRRIVWSPSLYLQRLRGSSKLAVIAQHIYDEGGARAFWRGNGVNCMKAGPEFALVFYVRSVLSDCIGFMKTRELRRERDGIARPNSIIRWSHFSQTAANFVCGAAAGAIAQTLLYPLELLKTRMAVAKSGEYPGGLRDCVMTSYRRGGVQDFYRGLTPNLMGIVPYRGIEVGLFYTLKQHLEAKRAKEAAAAEAAGKGAHHHVVRGGGAASSAAVARPHLTVLDTMTIGIIASVIAQTATYPLNIARTRLQTQGVNGRPILYTGMLDCFVKVLKSDGMCGLFSGLGANYLKAVPASAIVFVVFSETERRLDAWYAPEYHEELI